MKTRSTFGLLAVVLLFFSACGSDSDGGNALDAYAAAISTGIQADDDDDSIDIAPDEADCIGEASAELIGLDALEAVGTPDEVAEQTEDDLAVFDLSEGASLDIAVEYFDCVPSVFDQFVERFAEGDDDLGECLEDSIDEDDLLDVAAASIRGDDIDLGDDLLGAFETCQGLAAGDDDGPSGDAGGFEDYHAAITANIVATDGVQIGVTEPEAECIADEILTIIGEERTTSLGSPDEFVAATGADYSALDLEETELRAIATAYLDCSASAGDGFRAVFNESAGATGAQAECVNEVLTDEAIIELLTETFGGGDGSATLELFGDEIRACA